MEKLIFVVYSKSVCENLGGTAIVYCYVDLNTQDEINSKIDELKKNPNYIHVEYCSSYKQFQEQEKEWFKASKGFMVPVLVSEGEYKSKLEVSQPIRLNGLGFTMSEPDVSDIYTHYIFTGTNYFKIHAHLNESFTNLINICVLSEKIAA
ncbi:hypothetical protein A7M79_07245 [Acinetobacter baumannii]|uniref:hypothetical protein n=1 Tax=Acinetobacter baumannii TaxID=470 RepID=UPI0008DE7D4E|nr:hypothetical protein [Acinetobacter baumannii]OIH08602.1 hypothetical protein A7M79_07245 [Acinetobacter baumannii]